MKGQPLIVWGDPPPRFRSNQWEAVVAALKERPNTWGCVQRSPDARRIDLDANSLHRFGRTRGYDLQVARRLTDGGDHGLWAKWVEK